MLSKTSVAALVLALIVPSTLSRRSMGKLSVSGMIESGQEGIESAVALSRVQSPPKMRKDPADGFNGALYTYDQVLGYYKGYYSTDEIEAYWDDVMKRFTNGQMEDITPYLRNSKSAKEQAFPQTISSHAASEGTLEKDTKADRLMYALNSLCESSAKFQMVGSSAEVPKPPPKLWRMSGKVAQWWVTDFRFSLTFAKESTFLGWESITLAKENAKPVFDAKKGDGSKYIQGIYLKKAKDKLKVVRGDRYTSNTLGAGQLSKRNAERYGQMSSGFIANADAKTFSLFFDPIRSGSSDFDKVISIFGLPVHQMDGVKAITLNFHGTLWANADGKFIIEDETILLVGDLQGSKKKWFLFSGISQIE